MAGTFKSITEWVHGAGAKAGVFLLAKATLVGGAQTVTIPAGYEVASCVRTNSGGTAGHLTADTGGGSTTLTISSSSGTDTSSVSVLLVPFEP